MFAFLSRPFFTDRVHRWLLPTTAVAHGLLWLFTAAELDTSARAVPLSYNVIRGVTAVGPGWHLWQFPLLALFLLLLNWTLAWRVMSKDRVGARFLVGGTLFLQSLVLLVLLGLRNVARV